MSRCLLGVPCRFDGRARTSFEATRLAAWVRERGGVVVDVCPEVAGGLATPREPAEIVRGRLVTRGGKDVTEAFERGCASELARVRAQEVPLAVLCAKSPSCGVGYVYDGTHTGRLVAGDGMFAHLLRQEGVAVTTQQGVRACTPSVEHPVALVLGTGLGHLAGLVKPVRRIAYRDIAGFPDTASPLPGHRFEATVGTISGVPVVVYPGRVHLYQGYGALEVTSLVRHAHRLGCRVIVFACATGAIEGMAEPGLGIISDHINLTGTNPLVGWGREDELSRVDDGFFDMADVYAPYLRGLAQTVAAEVGVEVGTGVLAGVLGPSFETAAEVRALKVMGASYVGMSTVTEAIMAHALGMQVLALTLAANYAGEAHVSHQTVLAGARARSEDFERLVCGILTRL